MVAFINVNFLLALTATLSYGFRLTVHKRYIVDAVSPRACVNMIALENGTVVHLPAAEYARFLVTTAAEDVVTLNSKRDVDEKNINWSHLWKKGVVYFDIDGRTATLSNMLDYFSSYGSIYFELLLALSQALKVFHTKTCIRWKRRKPGDGIIDFVTITMPQANSQTLCNSPVGRQGGRQYLNVDGTCVESVALVLHQMMHVLGFYHTHTRPDRDKYIQIHTANIQTQYRKLFDKELYHPSYLLGFPYDYHSLMHLNSKKYSKDGKPTMTARLSTITSLGNEQGLSAQDVKMINSLYANCKDACRFDNGLCQQLCTDVKPGAVTCSCIKGFQLNRDRKTCYDYNECSDSNGGCDQICLPHGSWYRCACKKGYALDKNGISCFANDLCEDGLLKCDQGCLFNRCTCKEGYQLNQDGVSCDDVNECLKDNGGCESQCQNSIGSYKCVCPSGKYLSNDKHTCTTEVCPDLPQQPNLITDCTAEHPVENSICYFSCPDGFKLIESSSSTCKNRKWTSEAPTCQAATRCQINNGGCEQTCWAKSWTNFRCSCGIGYILHSNGKNCTDVEPPVITSCPSDIYANTLPAKSFASIAWDLPTFTDNSGSAKITSGPVMQDRIGGLYDIGSHVITYIVTDKAGLQATCTFKIKVKDVEPPQVFNCPVTQHVNISSTDQFINVGWEAPAFWDNSEDFNITTDLPENRKLQPRSQEIHYIAMDQSANRAVCTVKVIVHRNTEGCKYFPFDIIRGRMKCDKHIFGTICSPECDSGYQFLYNRRPASYLCKDGMWTPKPETLWCPAVAPALVEPTLTYNVSYAVKSCSELDTGILSNAAEILFLRSRSVLCTHSAEKCTADVVVSCPSELELRLTFYTSEPVMSQYPLSYLSGIRSRVLSSQSATFLYMKINQRVTPPEPMGADGLKTEPYIEFRCQNNDITVYSQLRCYRNP